MPCYHYRVNTLFSKTFTDEIKIPLPQIQDLMDSYRERQRTGVIRLAYASQQQVFFLFRRGRMLNAYQTSPERWEKQALEQSQAWIASAGEAYARTASLSAFGVLMTKISIEAGNQPPIRVERRYLAEYLAKYENGHQPALILTSWHAANGAVFFAPDKLPRMNFLAADMLLDEEGSYRVLLDVDEAQSQVFVFLPDLSTPAWQEYLLRQSFTSIFEALLARYEALTGRALIDSLARLTTTYAAHQNLDISIKARRVEDNEIFPAPQSAAEGYRKLLAEIFKHFSAVIGPRLHASNVRDVLLSLTPLEKQAIREFQLFPQGYSYE